MIFDYFKTESPFARARTARSMMTFAELRARLDADGRHALDERAAIREYDGGMSRAEAEAATARE